MPAVVKNKTMKTLVLNIDEVRRVVAAVGLNRLMDEVIDGLESAFRAFHPERTVTRVREGFQYDRPETGLLEWMPLRHEDGQITIKMVGYHPANPSRYGVPSVLATMLAYDSHRGHLRAMMDGTFLTAVRTGAASAVASRLLARPTSRVVGLIGCGAQSVTQLHALSRVFSIEQVLAYDIDPDASKSLAARTGFLGLPVKQVPVDEVVTESDIVCTCTSVAVGGGPVFRDVGCKPWAHFNAVGADFAGKFELPLTLLKRSLVCPDYLDQGVQEGECQQLTPKEVGPSLPELLLHKDLSSLREQTTVFDSTGWAVEDHVALEVFLRHALDLGIGRQVALAAVAPDATNPYAFLAG